MAEINIEVNIEETKWGREIKNSEEIITKACVAALKSSGVYDYADNIEISILLTNDQSIKELNSNYRYKDKPTNVLSFPQEALVAGKYKGINKNLALGDIIFAIETIQSEAAEQNKPTEHHLTHLAIHGTLHLLGFDHENDADAEIMEALEIKILSDMGIPSPY